MSALAVAAEHARLRRRIAEELRGEAREAWLRVDPRRISESWAAQLTRLLLVLTAGQLAAAWSIASQPAYRRRFGASLPAALRSRFALRIARGIVRDILTTSRAVTRVRRGRATMKVEASAFCGVRSTTAAHRPGCSEPASRRATSAGFAPACTECATGARGSRSHQPTTAVRGSTSPFAAGTRSSDPLPVASAGTAFAPTAWASATAPESPSRAGPTSWETTP